MSGVSPDWQDVSFPRAMLTKEHNNFIYAEK